MRQVKDVESAAQKPAGRTCCGRVDGSIGVLWQQTVDEEKEQAFAAF